MDQLLGAYHKKIARINLVNGANNLVLKSIKSTQLEQGQAKEFLAVQVKMTPNGIGVIGRMVIGTTNQKNRNKTQL